MLIPIFHRKKDNVEKFIDTSSFKNIINVIKALCSHDERLVDKIKKIKLGKQKGIIIDDSDLSDPVFPLITMEGILGKLGKSIFFQIIDKTPIPWRSFIEARDFVHTLNLKSKNDWPKYCSINKRPIDIPAAPDRSYKHQGWKGWGDWLGTGNKHSGDNNFLPFEEARKYVHTLSLKNGKDWLQYSISSDKPDFIPATPSQVYKNKGWKSLSDWLGTGRKHLGYKECISYDLAEKYVRKLNLKNEKQWRQYWKTHKPHQIPAKPDVYYKKTNQWISWGTFLGTGTVQPQKFLKRPFKEAKEYIHTLKLTTEKIGNYLTKAKIGRWIYHVNLGILISMKVGYH